MDNVKMMTRYMLAFRRIQDKAEADFISLLGNLSLQQLNVLNIIGDNEPCIMSTIAKQANLSLSSITLIVDKLVKGKLVERDRSAEDRRIVHAKLTLDGKKIYQVQIDHIHNSVQKLLVALTPEEQHMLLQILAKLTQR